MSSAIKHGNDKIDMTVIEKGGGAIPAHPPLNVNLAFDPTRHLSEWIIALAQEPAAPS